MSACMSATDSSGGSQDYFARIRGTVTRADGASTARAGIGVSCTGSDDQPFGVTADADANGRFEVDLNIPPVFRPLEGPVFACRVLTPYNGLPLVEKTVVIPVGTGTRPVTEVALVIP